MAGTAGKHAPFMGSVTATNTAQSLFSLLQGVWSDITDHMCFIQIQLDVSAGGTTLYIGNSNVASNMCGAALVASQIAQQLGFDSNILIPKDIYLLTSTASAQVNIIALGR